MDHTFCPGTKLLRQPKPEMISCGSCGKEVEIWSDELRVTCPHCSHTVVRQGFTSCLDWCKMGKECVGEEIYSNYMRNRALTIKDKLLQELETWFGTDLKRIEHAKAVLCFAEEMLRRGGGDWHIVAPAAILHDVGIKVAEEKYGSSAGNYQELEGPPVAQKILLKLGLHNDHIEEICAIIAHHHSPGENESINFKILYDSDCMVNVQETLKGLADDKKRDLFARTFLTSTGQKMAVEAYVGQA